MKTFKGVLLRVWFGLLFYALQYEYGSWSTYQSPLQMTGNTLFFIGMMYLFCGWGTILYENRHGKNFVEANYLPADSDSSRKWLWFYSALVFLIPALLITFYISFIKA